VVPTSVSPRAVAVIDHLAFGVVCCAVMPLKRPRKLSKAARAGDRLSIRIDLASGGKIGPGKIAVLEQIARTGSISAAGRTLKMSYKQTWDLVDDLNQGLGTAARHPAPSHASSRANNAR
jgi:hypothetical protein